MLVCTLPYVGKPRLLKQRERVDGALNQTSSIPKAGEDGIKQ